jgi:uncharacterized protein YlaN (UPF0358 family)
MFDYELFFSDREINFSVRMVLLKKENLEFK